MSQEEPGAARPGSADEVERRKGEHLQVASTADVGSRTGPGWPDVHLLHSALPVTDLVEVKEVGPLQLKGFHRPVVAYEVVGLKQPA